MTDGLRLARLGACIMGLLCMKIGLGGRCDEIGFINIEIRLDSIWVTTGDDGWLGMPESDPIQSVRPLGIVLKHTRSSNTRGENLSIQIRVAVPDILWLCKKQVRYDKLIPYFQYNINYNTTDPCSLSTKLSFCRGVPSTRG